MGDLLQSLRTNILETLKQRNQLEKISSAFGQLKTNRERVAYALKLPIIQQEISIQPPLNQKSSSSSASLRNEGNTFFQKRQLNKALEAYTQSILIAPSSDEKVLALAYANRSAVLFHMKEYDLCLRDIEYALGFKYPNDMLYKLLDRKARSLKAVGNFQEAKTVFGEALLSLKVSKLKKKDKDMWHKQLDKHVLECSSQVDVNLSSHESPLDAIRAGFTPPVQSYGINDQFVSASKALDIKANQAKGRHPVAARDIKIGDVLLIERPYASVLLQNQSKTHCHHCFTHVIAPLPCTSCADVRYCSEECARESWDNYHSIECKNLQHIYITGKYGHLALRVVFKAGYDFLKNTVSKLEAEASKSDESHIGCNDSGVYDPTDYQRIYHLVGHSKDRSVNDLFSRTITAIFLLKCLEETEYFESATSTKDQKKVPSRDQQAFIGGLLLRHLQNLPCNAHEISELQLSLKSVATSEAAEIGAGIYATLSLFNHSCDPSVTRFFYGDKCVVRAFCSIPAGHEVEDNYGVLSALTPRQQRQDTLQSQYYFKCECKACQEDSPLYSEIIKMETPSLKCGKCDLALAGMMADNGKLVICEKCGSIQDLEDKANSLRESETLYSDAMTKLLGEADVAMALPKLENHLGVLEECVCEPWQGYNSTQELMKQAYNILANCHLVD